MSSKEFDNDKATDINEDDYDGGSSGNGDAFVDDLDCLDDDYNNHDDHEDDDEEEEQSLYLNDPEHFDFECFPIDKIDSIVEKKCETLNNHLNFDDMYDSLYLLKKFKWNAQNIIETYEKDKVNFLQTYFSDNNNNKSLNPSSMDSVDHARLSFYINIYTDESKLFLKKETRLSSHLLALSNTCEICCLTKNTSEMLTVGDCLHYFCRECWRTHFELSIQSGTTSLFECMQTKCRVIASKDFVLTTLNNISQKSLSSVEKSKTLIEKYKKLVAVDLVKESEDLQICPGEIVFSENESNVSLTNTVPSKSEISLNSTHSDHKLNTFKKLDPQNLKSQKCNFIVWVKSKPTARRVKCTQCQTQYCFSCTMPYHAPNSCQTIRRWHIKCQDDSETRNYLLVHTQDCPKCKVCIEKSGGCSHMTCNRCKHEFCWVCLNDWKTHGATYDCNRYKGNPEQDNAREALNRYTHYYHRWVNHANSLKFEKALREQCQIRIEEKIMHKGGGTLVDWEFLTEAADTLTRARYTLQYTYPYAYFLDINEAKLLFENIQAELEREVENLSHSLEKVNLNDKFNIKSQMNIVEKRRKTLLKDFIN